MPRGRARLSRLRVVVVGCGVMGARHARVVAVDPDCELLTFDVRPERAEAVAAVCGGRAVVRIPDVDVAVVATPTMTHRAVAEPLLERGTWCLVEKPLAHDAEEARLLANAPRCAVGFSERHNRAVRAIGAVRPRTVQAQRCGPPTGRGLDVDVISDLLVHDLDLLDRWADGAALAEVTAHADRDTVHGALRFANGLRAEVHASRVALTPVRRAVLDGGVVLDLLAGRAWRDGVEELPADPRDALTVQWEQFVAAVRAGRAVDPGLRAVELADAVREQVGCRP